MTHPSTFELDALLLHALAPEEERRLRDHLEACDRCRAVLEELQRAQTHFRTAVQPRALQRLAEHRRSHRLRWWWLAPMAVGLMFALLPLPPPEPDLAPKGLALQVYARRDAEVFGVRDGDRLAPGDEVRFVVQPDGLPFLLVASVDGAGKASIYFPFGGTASAAVENRDQVVVPGSIRMDGTLGPERIHALLSSHPLDAATVLARLQALGARGHGAIRAGGPLDLGAQAELSLVIEKVERPAAGAPR